MSSVSAGHITKVNGKKKAAEKKPRRHASNVENFDDSDDDLFTTATIKSFDDAFHRKKAETGAASGLGPEPEPEPPHSSNVLIPQMPSGMQNATAEEVRVRIRNTATHCSRNNISANTKSHRSHLKRASF